MQYRNFFNSPAAGGSTGGNRITSYYKPNVKTKFPKKGPPTRIQILPAFNPQNPADPQGFVPCLVNGQPTAWFGMIQAAKFVGHGGGGNWKETCPILSLASFEGKEPCPYLKLLHYCKNNPDWKYLTEKTGHFGASDYQDAVLKPAKSILLLNIVEVDNPGAGVQLGEFSFSVASDLLHEETGLVFQRNLQLENYPNAEQALALNPMLAYANGDITDPAKAPIFKIELPPVTKGQFGAGYTCQIEVVNNKVSRRSCSDLELAGRYHLDDPESFLIIPTGQGIVDSLVSVLKGHVNAHGIDETCAIKEAVGDTYRVDLVSAPGAVSTVQSGFEAQPQASPAPVQTPVTPVPAPAPAPVQASATAPVQTPAPQPAPAPVQATQTAPAVAAAVQTVRTTVGAIPGETADPNLAASLAARMRTQMGLRNPRG